MIQNLYIPCRRVPRLVTLSWGFSPAQYQRGPSPSPLVSVADVTLLYNLILIIYFVLNYLFLLYYFNYILRSASDLTASGHGAPPPTPVRADRPSLIISSLHYTVGRGGFPLPLFRFSCAWDPFRSCLGPEFECT